MFLLNEQYLERLCFENDVYNYGRKNTTKSCGFSFQYQFGVERKLEWLLNKMSEIGDSLTKVEELFQEFEEFEQQAQVRFQVINLR